VPAALGGVITKEANANTIDCKAVVEGANEPTTPTADRILEERGIAVIPDFLANAGGVTVSYYEWAQNLQQYRWTHEQVNRELKATITKAYGPYGISRSKRRSRSNRGVRNRTPAGSGRGTAARKLGGQTANARADGQTANGGNRLGRQLTSQLSAI
jgi:glutamate dehydrogenase/leucine dehydrogenase